MIAVKDVEGKTTNPREWHVIHVGGPSGVVVRAIAKKASCDDVAHSYTDVHIFAPWKIR